MVRQVSQSNVDHEEGILFYIAGFLSRAEVKRLKCDSCLSMFVKSKSPPDIVYENLDSSKSAFLDQVNRGGLFTPTDIVYISVLHARQLYKKIFDKGEIQKKLLSMKNPRDTFASCF